MRTKLLFAALLCAILAYGGLLDKYYPIKLGDGKAVFQGPWVFEDVSNDRQDKTNVGGLKNTSRSFNQLQRYAWLRKDPGSGGWDYSTPCSEQFGDHYGLGFNTYSQSNGNSRYGVYSLYSHSESVPAYTRKRLTWNYKLCGFTNCLPQNVALYARDNMDDMKGTVVDFTHDYSNGAGSQYLLARTAIGDGIQEGVDRYSETGILTKTFDFDNRNGATTQVKTWVLLLTHVARNESQYTKNVNDQYGRFKDEGFSWQTFYYKRIFFNANGGKGTMAEQEIENSGTLTANAFTREHYTFAGWSTVQNGPIVYANGATITASEFDKGQRTLHAVWNRVDYGITYDLDGGTATNPTAYTEATETFTLANPTRENCTFLGWTGSNGETPELEVTIAQGSEGDKTFVAHWIYTAAASAVSLIDAIGTVEHTAESKAKIDAARAAYDALSAEAKTDVPASKLETLRVAEAAYAAEEPSTIRFMNKDASEQIGDDQQKAIYYPAFPEGATQWQTTEKNVSEDKTIVIKAAE